MSIGPEAEGPDKGQLTLFVPSGCISSPDEPLKVLKEYNYNIGRICYGSGNSKGMNPVEIASAWMIFKKVPAIRLVLETDRLSDTLLNKLMNNMIVVYVAGASLSQKDLSSSRNLSRVNVFKIVSPDGTCWIECKEIYFTLSDDDFYNNRILIK
jgi:hypothetical protein